MTAARTWTAETVENVLVAPLIENDTTPPYAKQGHRAVYHLAIPKTDGHSWEGKLVQFWGTTWAVIGIPTKGIDELVPGPWNKKVVVQQYCTGALDPETLWSNRIVLVSEQTETDPEGYRTVQTVTERVAAAIFTEGVRGELQTDDEKNAVRHFATVELWEEDYAGEGELRYDGRTYTVRASEPSGRGTVLLTAEEVWR